MPRISASSALSRLRILDFSRVRAGPTCVRQFADFGADVIKIESPPGWTRTRPWAAPRPGHAEPAPQQARAMTLNLKLPESKGIARAPGEDRRRGGREHRPDVKFRLGIDYASLENKPEEIILASISGFGQDGPYAKRPGFDQIAQGMSGLMSVTGIPARDRCAPARRSPTRPAACTRRSACSSRCSSAKLRARASGCRARSCRRASRCSTWPRAT